MNIKLIKDRILVKRTENKDKTASGFIIPEIAKIKQAIGEVVDVGPGYAMKDGTVRPLEIKKGDHVVFGSGIGLPMHFDDGDYLMMAEQDVMLVFNPEIEITR